MLKLFPAFALLYPLLFAQSVPPLTAEQKIAFLEKAAVRSSKGVKKGVTGTTRATLSDGNVTHDASIQVIDESKAKFETISGTEVNFQDSYKLNIAAYRLGRMLGLDSMIPVSVERRFNGKSASYTWWIENISMDEVDRLKKKLEAPDKDQWSRQYLIMKVFDQLICNMDRNATNLLYDKDWHLWMIDHSRAFRRHTQVLDRKALDRCDAVLLERIRKLNEQDLKRELGRWLDSSQIRGVMARAKQIVAHFDAAGPEKRYNYLPE